MSTIERRPREPLQDVFLNDIDVSFKLLTSNWALPEAQLTADLNLFQEHIDKTYTSVEDRALITRALKLATVLHQRNEKPIEPDGIDPKLRREEDYPGHQQLYISHPLAVATALAGVPRKVKLRLSDEKGYSILNVHQNPAKAEVVAAALLHDVVEDVHFGGKKGDEIRDVIRDGLGGIPRTEKVLRIVDAVTHTKIEDLTDEVREGIENSALFESITSELIKKKHDKDPAVIKRQVTRTIADIHKMFTVSFPEAMFGRITDEDLETFFDAFVVKAHDIEHNLETKTRDDKLMRAHLFAVMARIMDFPVASRLGLHLIADQDLSIFGGAHSSAAEENLGKAYIRAEASNAIRGQHLTVKSRHFTKRSIDFPVTANQIPIMFASELQTALRGSGEPVIQYKIELKRGQLWLASKAGKNETIPISFGNVSYEMRQITDSSHDALRQVGRNVVYYEILDTTGASVAIVRCNDTQPTAHDITKLGSNTRIKDIPERKFYTGHDGSIGSTLRIITPFYPRMLQEEAA